jgi:hypothetical protein
MRTIQRAVDEQREVSPQRRLLVRIVQKPAEAEPACARNTTYTGITCNAPP